MEETEHPDIEQQRSRMAAILGLDEPVSEQVWRAAATDETYAHHLLVCRGEPDFLRPLLANPPAPPEAEPVATGALLLRAADSLVRWARTGFSTVGDDVYRQRLAACAACPNLRQAPASHKTLYALAGADADKDAICGKCGCVVSVKARRGSDTCPAPHPLQEGINRWNEPRQA